MDFSKISCFFSRPFDLVCHLASASGYLFCCRCVRKEIEAPEVTTRLYIFNNGVASREETPSLSMREINNDEGVKIDMPLGSFCGSSTSNGEYVYEDDLYYDPVEGLPSLDVVDAENIQCRKC